MKRAKAVLRPTNDTNIRLQITLHRHLTRIPQKTFKKLLAWLVLLYAYRCSVSLHHVCAYSMQKPKQGAGNPTKGSWVTSPATHMNKFIKIVDIVICNGEFSLYSWLNTDKLLCLWILTGKQSHALGLLPQGFLFVLFCWGVCVIILKLGSNAHWPYYFQMVFLCTLNSVNCHIRYHGHLGCMLESHSHHSAPLKKWEPMAESSAVNTGNVSPLSTKVPKIKVGYPLVEYQKTTTA